MGVKMKTMQNKINRRSVLNFGLLLGLGAGLGHLPLITRASAAAAKRVVAIGGRVTEIIYALGAESALIARDATSVFPEAALKLPDVGYMRAVSPEGVLAVKPDLILATIGSGPPEAMDVLKKAAVRVVDVPQDFSATSLLAAVDLIAAELEVAPAAAALKSQIEGEFAELAKLTETATTRKTVLFIYTVNDDRFNCSGTKTAAHSMITLAGADNLFTGFEGYKEVGTETILEANPDAILLMARQGDGDITVESLKANPVLAQTNAVKNGKFIKMRGDYLLGFGPRTALAGMDLHKAIYG